MVPDQAAVLDGSLKVDQVRVAFDDERLVANAGLMLPASLAGRLGIEELVNDTVDLGRVPGSVLPGRKAVSYTHLTLPTT